MTETPNSQNSPSAAADRGPYRVVIVDDHAMFRTGVKAEIGRSVAVVGEAAVGMAKQPDSAGACPALTSAVSRQGRCRFPAP